MSATISRDLPGARLLRRYGLILVMLGLTVAAVAPGMIAGPEVDARSGAVTRIPIDPPARAVSVIAE